MTSICTYQHFYGDSKICFLFEIFQMCSLYGKIGISHVTSY